MLRTFMTWSMKMSTRKLLEIALTMIGLLMVSTIVTLKCFADKSKKLIKTRRCLIWIGSHLRDYYLSIGMLIPFFWQTGFRLLKTGLKPVFGFT